MVTRDVPAGHVLTADDLGVENVKGTGDVAFISGSDRDSQVGRPAAVDLVAGQPLVAADLGAAPSDLASGQAVVAIPLQSGAFPPRLAAGDHVLVIDTGTASTAIAPTPAAPPQSIPATVISVDQTGGSLQGTQGETVVSLRVPSASVEDVARAGAAGHASIAVLPPDG